ncbi:MAG: hypothetical protein NUV57_01710 [archaeon]|nr:hypothetical protein [archaeon]
MKTIILFTILLLSLSGCISFTGESNQTKYCGVSACINKALSDCTSTSIQLTRFVGEHLDRYYSIIGPYGDDHCMATYYTRSDDLLQRLLFVDNQLFCPVKRNLPENISIEDYFYDEHSNTRGCRNP